MEKKTKFVLLLGLQKYRTWEKDWTFRKCCKGRGKRIREKVGTMGKVGGAFGE